MIFIFPNKSRSNVDNSLETSKIDSRNARLGDIVVAQERSNDGLNQENPVGNVKKKII